MSSSTVTKISFELEGDDVAQLLRLAVDLGMPLSYAAKMLMLESLRSPTHEFVAAWENA